MMRSVLHLVFYIATTIAAFPLRDSMFSLRTIIGSKAVLSTVITEVNNEMVNENIIISEITSVHRNIPIDAFNAFIFIGAVYLQYRYFIYFEKKLSGVKMFSNIQEKTRLILFIMMLVFTKNIQNAI